MSLELFLNGNRNQLKLLEHSQEYKLPASAYLEMEVDELVDLLGNLRGRLPVIYSVVTHCIKNTQEYLKPLPTFKIRP